jgi:transposase-like protein
MTYACGTGVDGKTVITDVGPVEINVPRDRDAGFEPKIVRQAVAAAAWAR